MSTYEVIVGNVGAVYRGTSRTEAEKTFREYVALTKSRAGGRAWGESVDLYKDGEIIREHAASGGQRRRRRHGSAMTEKRARVIEESHSRWERARESFDPKRYKRGGGYTPEEWKTITRRAGLHHGPSNEARGKVEAYRFKTNPPEKFAAYYTTDMREITTWTGVKLGDIVWKGAIRRGFGGGKSQSIRVRGINGVMYAGTCNLTGGTYCRLKRMASSGSRRRAARNSRGRFTRRAR